MDYGSVLQETLTLEKQVWDALVAGDREADESLLTLDFLGVYPTGFATRADHSEQLAGTPQFKDFSITQARVIEINSDTRMLAYKARFRRPWPDAPTEEMYVSSLWIRSDGAWLNRFSQDTPTGHTTSGPADPAGPPPPPPPVNSSH